MTLRIERSSDRYGTTIRLVGRLQAEHVYELMKQIAESSLATVLDLQEVTLVDLDVVRFLGTCEAGGTALINCSPYISDWIAKEKR